MDIRAYNRDAWNKEVNEGDNRWTQPVSREIIAKAKQGEFSVVLTENISVPKNWFPALKGVDVLCLASGGGQQGPMFAAVGAHVTVFDNSPGQLKQDQLVAEREALSIQTVEGDAADLSMFADESFDLVFSTILLHELPPVVIQNMIAEIHRLLKPGGLTAHLNLPPYSQMSAYNAFLMNWETHNNGEPYWHAFHKLDLPAVFRVAGFKKIREVAAESKSTGRGAYSGQSPYLVTMAEK